MDDDFNTGGAVGALYELLNALNRFADERKLEDAAADAKAKAEFTDGVQVLKELSQILGLFRGARDRGEGRRRPARRRADATAHRPAGGVRKAKNFAVADQIRKRLAELGVTLEDRPGGTGCARGIALRGGPECRV